MHQPYCCTQLTGRFTPIQAKFILCGVVKFPNPTDQIISEQNRWSFYVVSSTWRQQTPPKSCPMLMIKNFRWKTPVENVRQEAFNEKTPVENVRQDTATETPTPI